MKTILMALLVSLASQASQATDKANYFRVWQGFQKSDLSKQEFMGELPSFMKETVDLYKDRALNNYIVAIPPSSAPSYVPHELALVALTSEEDYRQIRQTPEGQKYSARHWDVFDRATSQSAKTFIDYNTEKPQHLTNNWAYDMFGKSIDWAKGANFVFVGTRKKGLSDTDYLDRLKKHIELARDVMGPKGLKGYIVIANKDYEIAFLNWNSKKAHDLAVESKGGQQVFGDAGEFMDVQMYEQAKPFAAGSPVTPGAAYSTLQ